MFAKLIADLAQALDQASIPYVVIGGQAVLIHGEPRFTRDIDVTLGIGPESLPDVLVALSRLGWSALPQDPREFVSQTMVLPCEDRSSGIRIDFIFGLTAFETATIDRAVLVDMEGTPVKFAGAEDLVVHKMIAGRPRDLEDVVGIVAKNPSLDTTRIITTLREFEAMLEQEFVTAFEGIWLKRDK